MLLPNWVRNASSPPVIIGTPALSMRKAVPVRAALRWSATMPFWFQLWLLSSPPSDGPYGQGWLFCFVL